MMSIIILLFVPKCFLRLWNSNLTFELNKRIDFIVQETDLNTKLIKWNNIWMIYKMDISFCFKYYYSRFYFQYNISDPPVEKLYYIL